MNPFAELSPPYSTIVADPPWHYDEQVSAWDARSERLGRTKPMPYTTMSDDEIARLPVVDLAAPGAHLYLWTTNQHLWAARDIAIGWGFKPTTTLVWCKKPKGVGPGGTFSITTEFVLFCRDTRRCGAALQAAREAAGLSRGDVHRAVRGGKPTGIVYRWEADDCLPTEDDWVALSALLPALRDAPYPAVVPPSAESVETTWWEWPRGAHSAKPPAFLDMVERVSPGPYVELFARAPRLGWDSWGKGYELGEAS